MHLPAYTAHSWSKRSWFQKFASVENVWKLVNSSLQFFIWDDGESGQLPLKPSSHGTGDPAATRVQSCSHCTCLGFSKQFEWFWREWNIAVIHFYSFLSDQKAKLFNWRLFNCFSPIYHCPPHLFHLSFSLSSQKQ